MTGFVVQGHIYVLQRVIFTEKEENKTIFWSQIASKFHKQLQRIDK